ncbi:MAG TPA: HEAT repeat domain-containing protein [Longimicrobium sp.]|nr:HEAT repeat domain-containing protein [Longimicrobium sp.]
MADVPAAAARFVRALAAAVLREGEPDALAADARAALDGVFAAQKSLVLDVQFTGFAQKGQLVGGVDPAVLRAAGQLIMLRVTRLGFTPEAGQGDLAALFAAVSRPPGELGPDGVAGAMASAAPRGIYVSAAGGAVYKPAPTPKPTATPTESTPKPPEAAAEQGSAPAAEAPPQPAAAQEDAGDWDLAEFDLVDSAEILSQQLGGGPSAAEMRLSGEVEPPSTDMYHFFRATDEKQAQTEVLPRLLAEADNVTRFDELAQAAARSVLALVRSDAHPQAVELLDALVREADRPDRNRFFRESAVGALRRAGTPETLHRLLDLLPTGGEERERILRFFVFMGREALELLQGALFRTQEPELRAAIFRALLGVQGTHDRLVAVALQEAGPARIRTLLELARGPEVDADLARRWAAEAAKHAEPAVRVEAARGAANLGGRAAMRVLLDLLSDGDRQVRMAAIQGLGAIGEAAAVPFLARALSDSADEELQVAAAAALGRIGSPDALPGLLTIATKRSLFAGKRAQRLKIAAVQAIARIPTPAARDALASIAAGKDDLAEEARRLLAAT